MLYLRILEFSPPGDEGIAEIYREVLKEKIEESELRSNRHDFPSFLALWRKEPVSPFSLSMAQEIASHLTERLGHLEIQRVTKPGQFSRETQALITGTEDITRSFTEKAEAYYLENLTRKKESIYEKIKAGYNLAEQKTLLLNWQGESADVPNETSVLLQEKYDEISSIVGKGEDYLAKFQESSKNRATWWFRVMPLPVAVLFAFSLAILGLLIGNLFSLWLAVILAVVGLICGISLISGPKPGPFQYVEDLIYKALDMRAQIIGLEVEQRLLQEVAGEIPQLLIQVNTAISTLQTVLINLNGTSRTTNYRYHICPQSFRDSLRPILRDSIPKLTSCNGDIDELVGKIKNLSTTVPKIENESPNLINLLCDFLNSDAEGIRSYIMRKAKALLPENTTRKICYVICPEAISTALEPLRKFSSDFGFTILPDSEAQSIILIATGEVNG